jgi:aspartyl-tRNA(Asn)/glutamyl-tRNA(Gln) amidotransferase subunit A
VSTALPDDPSDWTVDLLAASYRDGSASPVDVARASFDRVRAVDPEVNAFVWIDEEGALAQARDSEARWRAGEQLGDLDGVTVTIKDLLPYLGHPTLKGSRHSDPSVLPTEEAPTVLRLREAGAVVLGATTTPEFGWKGGGDSPLTGITRNPWDRTRTTGGSSAGAGAAAAAGMGVLHVGTDGGGSVRMPAAFCGIVGLKPTHTIVPIHPAAVSGMLSHVGPMARTVRDAAHLMSAIARPDSRDVYPSLRDDRSWLDGIEDGVAGLRIAYAPRFARADVDPRIAAAVDAAVEVLAGLGAQVDVVEPPGADVRDAFLTLWDAALGRALRGMSDEQLAMSDPGLVATMRRRAAISADDFLDADAARGALTAQISALLTSYDLLVSPQTPVLAFPVGQDVADPATQEHWVDWTPYTYPINMSRHPAATVPVGLSDTGPADGALPMAMQIVGRHFDDRLVLRAARAYEQVHPVVVPRY